MEYGLIGEKLGHSFSKEIHESIKDYIYELKELDLESFHKFMEEKAFKAINVTIPYKEKVIPYLDYIDPAAKKIGAVNTIVNKKNKLYGYNTDYLGLKSIILKNKINVQDKNILILGNGGTAKTATQVLKDLKCKNIKYAVLEPTKDDYSFENCYEYQEAEVIVNATPVGMYPNSYGKLIDINKFNKLEAVVDVIYNPLKTPIILDAIKKELKYATGLYMLVAQAVYAADIFTDTKSDYEVINDVYKKIINQKKNIVLIGMPSSGKTTIGKKLSKLLEKEFIDTDILVEEKLGMPIKDFLNSKTEQEFRKIETEVVMEVSKLNNVVIATGGGVIKNNKNIDILKSNGIVLFIDRKLKNLIVTDSRPLSNDIDKLTKLYEERYPIYLSSCDLHVKNNYRLNDTIQFIIKEVTK